MDSSARYALIAVQGPAALDTVQPLTGADLGAVRPYWFTYGEVAQARALRQDPNQSVKEICATLRISPATFYRYLRT